MTIGAGTWSFAGVSFNQAAQTVVKIVDGALALPPRRGSNPTPFARSGELWAQKPWQARRLILTLSIYPDLSQPDPHLAMYTQLDLLDAAFSTPGLQSLEHDHPDGTTRLSQAEVVSYKLSRQLPATAVFYEGLVDFLLPDPWFYGPAVTVGGSASFVITNPGPAPTESILLSVLGAASPNIANATTGDSVSFAGSGDLLINCYDRTVSVGGINAIAQISHAGQRYLSLASGANALSFSGGGTLSVTFKPAYV
jgi:hypothetical protein